MPLWGLGYHRRRVVSVRAVPPRAIRLTTKARVLSGFAPVVGNTTIVVEVPVSSAVDVGPSLVVDVGASGVVVGVDAAAGSVVVVDEDSSGVAGASAAPVTEAVPSR